MLIFKNVFISISLLLCCSSAAFFLVGCESETAKEERLKKEHMAKVFAPREEKLDPKKAKNFDPYADTPKN